MSRTVQQHLRQSWRVLYAAAAFFWLASCLVYVYASDGSALRVTLFQCLWFAAAGVLGYMLMVRLPGSMFRRAIIVIPLLLVGLTLAGLQHYTFHRHPLLWPVTVLAGLVLLPLALRQVRLLTIRRRRHRVG